jgi:hypothetical protein
MISDAGSVRLCTDSLDIFLPNGKGDGQCGVVIGEEPPNDFRAYLGMFIIRTSGFIAYYDCERKPIDREPLGPGRYHAWNNRAGTVYIKKSDDNLME